MQNNNNDLTSSPSSNDIPSQTAIEEANWYLVYTKPRQEYRAQSNLLQQAFEVFLPLHHSEHLLRGKLRVLEEPLFKRYLFVRFNAHKSPWHTIRNTLGVSGLVRTGDQPTKVPSTLVQTLKQKPIASQELFQRGETLYVTNGAFRDLQVVYEMQDGDSRAMVLIELLNKMQKISINLNALSKKT